MTDPSLLELLATTDLFRHFSRSALEILAPRFLERTYLKGQVLFHEGDPGNSLWVLVTGLVKVSVASSKGDEMLLVTLAPPETFGELSLIDGSPRSATVEVVETSRVLILGRDVWSSLMRDDPAFTEAVLTSVAQMVRRLTDQTSDFAFLDLHGRVAKLIAGFADDRGRPIDGGLMLDLHLTQADLARMVGGSRQSVNQILRALEERGYVELQRQSIVVKKLEALRRRAGL
jgi:CRP-like cAMP-binding protein